LNRLESPFKLLFNSKTTKTDMPLRKVLVAIGFFFAVLAAIAAWFGVASVESVEVPRISIEKARELLGSPDVIIIDVRTAKTWWRSSTKILNAVREEPGAVEKWAATYPKDKTLILYCS
jgi:hypothetical protein